MTYCAILLSLPRTPQLSWYDPADSDYAVELPWSGRGNLGPHSLRVRGFGLTQKSVSGFLWFHIGHKGPIY